MIFKESVSKNVNSQILKSLPCTNVRENAIELGFRNSEQKKSVEETYLLRKEK